MTIRKETKQIESYDQIPDRRSWRSGRFDAAVLGGGLRQHPLGNAFSVWHVRNQHHGFILDWFHYDASRGTGALESKLEIPDTDRVSRRLQYFFIV